MIQFEGDKWYGGRVASILFANGAAPKPFDAAPTTQLSEITVVYDDGTRDYRVRLSDLFIHVIYFLFSFPGTNLG